MRLSDYFLPVIKETPKEAETVSHQLMLRAGLVRQQAAGIYAWLPLGLRVLKRIEAVVREEMDRTGAMEMLMPTIQSADLWRESGRYDDYGPEMLRITDRHERALLYGPTNEEMITEIFRNAVRSYKDLPLNLYHIQWKFRDEIRPRFGVMRGREFLMKDAYSFDIDAAAGEQSYYRMFAAYLRIFHRLGLQAVPCRAESGPIGGDLSHEFAVLADTGETALYCHADLLDIPAPPAHLDYGDATELAVLVRARTQHYAATDAMHDAAEFAKIPSNKQVARRGIEVGHIFHFGDKYSKPMGAKVALPDGTAVPVQMGSYGVGVSRLAGAIIEASHDELGIVWPQAAAPFDVGLICTQPDDPQCAAAAEELYDALGYCEVLYDDTAARPGTKFANMDLIGLPYQVVVGPKGMADNTVEIKCRATNERTKVEFDAAEVANEVGDLTGCAWPKY